MSRSSKSRSENKYENKYEDVDKSINSPTDDSDSWKANSEDIQIQICRQNEMGVQVNKQLLMGKAYRSPITGQVSMHRPHGMPDFSIVDLWTRQNASGSIRELEKDAYIFRPVALVYRTWLYHDKYRQKFVQKGVDEYGMLKHVLGERCIDAAVSGGRWSPVMCYGPLVLVSCLTGSQFLVLVGIFMVAVLYAISSGCNHPSTYSYIRPTTFIPRVLFALFVMWQFSSRDGTGGTLALVGYLFAIACMAIDFLNGDLSLFLNFKLTCSYEVLRCLPNRCFICRRIGAAHFEEMFGSRGEVPETISGMGRWEHNLALIADIKGLIVELRPMRQKDWKLVQDMTTNMNKDQWYFGLDVYDSEVPSARAIDMLQKHLDEVVESNMARLPPQMRNPAHEKPAAHLE